MAKFQKRVQSTNDASVSVPVLHEVATQDDAAPTNVHKNFIGEGNLDLVSVRFVNPVNLGVNGHIQQVASTQSAYTIYEVDDGVMIRNQGGYLFFVPTSNINSIQYGVPKCVL